MIRSLIQLAAPASVQRRWGGWLRPRDELPAKGTGGAPAQMNGEGLSERTVCAVGILLIVFSGIVGAFSDARDIAWRLGSPHNLWEPALWESTSNIVAIALLPIARHGARLIGPGRHRPVTLAVSLVALALTYSALHIAGMGFMREWAYGIAGWSYAFPWARQVPYELRKDLFAFTAFVVVFWLGTRTIARGAAKVDEITPNAVAAPQAAPFWLRDGRISVLVEPCEIVSVISAGNYVEYQLTGGRTHLIRATLQSQEERLARFGIVRVHRGRLLNLKRIVALEWRASGDFELRLDTGETIAGSRRFKAVVAGLAA